MNPQKIVTLVLLDQVVIVCGDNLGNVWLERYEKPNLPVIITRATLGTPTHVSGLVRGEEDYTEWVEEAVIGRHREELDDWTRFSQLVYSIRRASEAIRAVQVVV